MENHNDQGGCGKNCHSYHAGVKKTLIIALGILSLFLLAKTVNEFKATGYVGKDSVQQSLITVSGKGEVVVIPDTAEISFSVIGSKPNVADAQIKATELGNEAVDFLKEAGIEEKDIKTTNYNISPRYNYVSATPGYYGGTRVLAGYEVTQSFRVKIKEIEDAGKILGGLGNLGVQNISGLTFSVDNEDVLKRQARSEAIEDAQTQAERLAKDLGVKLVRIINFSEGGNYPTYYAKAESLAYGVGGDTAPTPSLPAGENTITSNITITYEIR